MALEYYINSIQIDPNLITSSLQKDETLEYDNGKIITPQCSFELDSSYESIFEAASWYNWSVKIYDTTVNRYLWDGRLRNVIVDDSKMIVKLETVHYIDDTRTVYNYSITSQTPAAIVYSLLTDATYGAGIPTDYILYWTFQEAISIQTAANVLMSIAYTDDSDVEIKTIIEEILRIASCRLFCVGNYIGIKQLQVYAGETGYRLDAYNVVANSYNHEFDSENIVNQYYVAYNNSGVIAYATGSNTTSRTTYGRLVFGVPEGTDLGTGDSEDDCSILLDSLAAATWCGELALDLNPNHKKKGTVKTFLEFDYPNLGDIINLNFRGYVNEPVMVTSKKYDRKNGTITYEFDFLNQPVQIVSRDTTAPAAPVIMSAITIPTGFVIRFTQNTETDYIGNRIYFSESSDYHSEICHKGASPIDVKVTDLVDGLLYQPIYRLSPGTQYNVYITAYDTSDNESEPSNTATVTAGLNEYPNEYYTDGDPYITGVTLDVTNSNAGTGTNHFPYTFPFDLVSPCAVYTSAVKYNQDGYSIMRYIIYGNISMYYRTSSDNVTWSAWTYNGDTSATLALNTEYLQFRFDFYSAHWYDEDYFYIRNLE